MIHFIHELEGSPRLHWDLKPLHCCCPPCSYIEGELRDQAQVRSSLAQRLGMISGALVPADRAVEGIVEMMVNATQRYAEPLTEEWLFGWPDGSRIRLDREGACPLRGPRRIAPAA